MIVQSFVSQSGEYTMAISYEVPTDWGQDPLSEFIDTTRQNTIATFANLRPQYSRLRDIHILASIMASATPVASVRGQGTSIPKEQGVR